MSTSSASRIRRTELTAGFFQEVLDEARSSSSGSSTPECGEVTASYEVTYGILRMKLGPEVDADDIHSVLKEFCNSDGLVRIDSLLRSICSVDTASEQSESRAHAAADDHSSGRPHAREIHTSGPEAEEPQAPGDSTHSAASHASSSSVSRIRRLELTRGVCEEVLNEVRSATSSANTSEHGEVTASYETIFSILRARLSPDVDSDDIHSVLNEFCNSDGFVRVESLLRSTCGIDAAGEQNACGVQLAPSVSVQGRAVGTLDYVPLLECELQSEAQSAKRSLWEAPCIASLRSFLLSKEPTLASAWRRILDRGQRGKLTQRDFCNALKSVGYRASLLATWRQLDADSRGFITMADLDWNSASLLGHFHCVAVSLDGSVTQAVQHTQGDRKLIRMPAFRKLLRSVGLVQHADALFAMLTDIGVEAISLDSFLWLDKIGPSLPQPQHLRTDPGRSAGSYMANFSLDSVGCVMRAADGSGLLPGKLGDWSGSEDVLEGELGSTEVFEKLYREGMERHHRFESYDGLTRSSSEGALRGKDGIAETCDRLHAEAKLRASRKEQNVWKHWEELTQEKDIHAGKAHNEKVFQRLLLPRRNFPQESNLDPVADTSREQKLRANARSDKLHRDHALKLDKMEAARRQKESELESSVSDWQAKYSRRPVNMDRINRLYRDAQLRKEEQSGTQQWSSRSTCEGSPGWSARGRRRQRSIPWSQGSRSNPRACGRSAAAMAGRSACTSCCFRRPATRRRTHGSQACFRDRGQTGTRGCHCYSFSRGGSGTWS